MGKSKLKSSSTVGCVHDTVSERQHALLWGFSADRLTFLPKPIERIVW